MIKSSSKLKTYFLILNLVISIIAISALVGAEETIPGTTDNKDKPEGTDVDGTIVDPDADGATGIGGGDDTPGGPDDATGDTTGGDTTGGPGGTGTIGGKINSLGWMSAITKAGIFAGIGGSIGNLAGGDDGLLWGSVAGATAGAITGLFEKQLGTGGAMLLGLGVGAAIFLATYKKSSTELVEFQCLPWQAPIGGEDCETCQDFEDCSEYTCKSLGQACAIVNPGTLEQKCVWQNPHDVNSPTIEFKKVNKGLTYKPDNSLRPPATGVIINRESETCIQAFTPLEFEFNTNEPAQCKIDYNLTTGFDEMSFYVGGDSLLRYNHTETLSLPGPATINAIAPELKNNGEYRLFVRCQDANGNYNQDAYSVSFCVDKGPDTTPPKIVDVNIPSNNPILYDKTNLELEVYLNEPSECNWDREDRDFKDMANEMDCKLNVWEMNSQNVYTCKADLTGIENRKENKYYFRCKDKPWAEEGDRNTNSQSYLYVLLGTQPLNIIEVKPTSETISGEADVIPVFLEIKTDNGHDNGESLCYYHQGEPSVEEDYILFSETKSNIHKQRQDLAQGDYTYYLKCIDLGGNTAYNTTTFKVETDREPPMVVRTYKESSELKIITSEKSGCSFSTKDCNFEIEDAILMTTFDSESHTAEWTNNQNYFIRCMDEFNNQPYPNTCSIILKPTQFTKQDTGVIIL